MGPSAGLDGCGKSRLHRDSIPGPYSSWRVAIPTELSRHVIYIAVDNVGSSRLPWATAAARMGLLLKSELP